MKFRKKHLAWKWTILEGKMQQWEKINWDILQTHANYNPVSHISIVFKITAKISHKQLSSNNNTLINLHYSQSQSCSFQLHIRSAQLTTQGCTHTLKWSLFHLRAWTTLKNRFSTPKETIIRYHHHHCL